MFGEILKNPDIANSLNEYTKEKLYQSIHEHESSSQDIKPYFGNPALLDNYSDSANGSKVAANPGTAPQQQQPVILTHGHEHDDIHNHEEVEETLNIMDKEKELINKALKKHRGKRKDAAYDLGISERTLYRKLKEYHIDG